MTTPTAGSPATPDPPVSGPQPTARFAHGLAVTLPGFHTATVYTATDDDSETIGDMLRHNGCQVALFDYAPATEGTYSR